MKIIYINFFGGVSVVHPTGELSIEEVAKVSVPDGVPYELVEDDAIPINRTFRNAWNLVGSKVSINITKAQEITKDRLRAEREPLLVEQDIAYMKALETNSDTTAIVAEKQRLRDITNQVDSMTTVVELKGATV